MDAKTIHADGSIETAVLTDAAPAVGAGASLAGVLAKGGANGPALDLGAALQNYALVADLSIRDFGGTMRPVRLDHADAMRDALADGTASSWQKGALATGTRVDMRVSGLFHLTVDLTVTADGKIHVSLGLDNDLAMGGGTLRSRRMGTSPTASPR